MRFFLLLPTEGMIFSEGLIYLVIPSGTPFPIELVSCYMKKINTIRRTVFNTSIEAPVGQKCVETRFLVTFFLMKVKYGKRLKK